MATRRLSPEKRRLSRARSIPVTSPIIHQPGKGLLVSMRARFPESASDKVVCAKSVIKAVVAAHDAAADMGNYDIHYPLELVIDLLEDAQAQIGLLEDATEKGRPS